MYLIFVDVYRGRVLRNIGIIETKTGYSLALEPWPKAAKILAQTIGNHLFAFGDNFLASRFNARGWRLIKRPEVVCLMKIKLQAV